MTMEIKQGDRVRVSKDAPKVYTNGSFDMFYMAYDSEVLEVEDDHAVIKSSVHVQPMARLIIPTRYLIKVDAEAKEPKFKVGDIVTHKNSPHIWRCVTAIMSDDTYVLDGEIYDVEESDLDPYTEPTAPEIKVGDRVRNIESGLIGIVDKIVYGNIAWVNGVDGKRYHWKSDGLGLIKPTEQTEAKKPNHTIKIPVEVDLTDSYWDTYTADLAKEVAVMLVRTHRNDLNKVAKMSVDIAKSVVEGLKRK